MCLPRIEFGSDSWKASMLTVAPQTFKTEIFKFKLMMMINIDCECLSRYPDIQCDLLETKAY